MRDRQATGGKAAKMIIAVVKKRLMEVVPDVDSR
jgi:hypothetical protein